MVGSTGTQVCCIEIRFFAMVANLEIQRSLQLATVSHRQIFPTILQYNNGFRLPILYKSSDFSRQKSNHNDLYPSSEAHTGAIVSCERKNEIRRTGVDKTPRYPFP